MRIKQLENKNDFEIHSVQCSIWKLESVLRARASHPKIHEELQSIPLADVRETEVPLPRFGHTTTLVDRNRVILFGGATGDSGRYTITQDTFALEMGKPSGWTKINPEGPPFEGWERAGLS